MVKHIKGVSFYNLIEPILSNLSALRQVHKKSKERKKF